MLVATGLFGQASADAAQKEFTLDLDVNILLVVIAAFLLLPLWKLADGFLMAAKHHYSVFKKSNSIKVLIPLLIISGAIPLHAQFGITQTGDTAGGVNSGTLTLVLLSLIGLELLLMVYFARKIDEFLRPATVPSESKPSVSARWVGWIQKTWSKMNFRPMEEEAQIDLGHDYDGIRELDNVIPPWFTTAFILTILFAGVYLYRYHIAKSAPLQVEELEMAMARAELEHEAYLAKQATLIDETNVALMSGGDLEAGKQVFNTLCAVCHMQDGGGQVGPNLTDDYWIHGGRLQDIFKTVKYGVPDKGMISWKAQLSPMQMAQVSNYILTFRGTQPADPKAPQGELYIPETVTDTSTVSSVPSADTTATR
jgi:cytochrome c oxidase cbb3-type subunit 3